MSSVAAYAMVLLTVLLTAYGQFAVKWQVLRAGPVPEALPDKLAYVMGLLLNPWILSSFLAAVLASVSWMLAMSRLELSHAYPITALTFVLVAIGSRALFEEPLSIYKVVGLILIIAGIIVSTRG